MFGSVFSNPFMAIVAVILMLVLGWQFLKLTVECVERYIVFYFVLYCAPVVFATGAFKSTAQIFKSWCRMVASQAMLLLINIWSIKLFLSFMPVFESNSGDIVFNFLMGFAFLKFAQKADTLLRILGLNTASTGDMVRSLGGTIAGIAMTLRTAGTMASAVGRHFGGGESGSKKSSSGDENNGGSRSGDSISGMGNSTHTQGEAFSRTGGAAPGGVTTPGGVTASGISAAKQGFSSAVFKAAHSQMETIPPAWSVQRKGRSPSIEEGPERQERDEGIAMKPSELPKDAGGLQNLDAETLEGLSNLAHGLPHDNFDAEKGVWSGGGFPEFTGEEANIIGASQLLSAEGISRSMVKMADGSTGTVYRNEETGESHMVQFASVDNGVMQGTMSRIDPETGKIGEAFAFQAVHSSVPGAETFSTHSVPVGEPSGGVYHVATGGDTSIFAAASAGTVQAAGSAYTPGGASRMEQQGQSGINQVEVFQSVTDATASQVLGPSALMNGEVPQPQAPGTKSPITGETPRPVQPGPDPPPAPRMEPPQNQVRRFSRNNPSNFEVFRRDSGQVESFGKPKPGPESGPEVAPPKK